MHSAVALLALLHPAAPFLTARSTPTRRFHTGYPPRADLALRAASANDRAASGEVQRLNAYVEQLEEALVTARDLVHESEAKVADVEAASKEALGHRRWRLVLFDHLYIHEVLQ